jgi:hypothetical protein
MLSACKNSEKTNQKNGNVITTDITNFWNAYDQIITTQDSVLQYKYLDSLYLDKGTAGLEVIQQKNISMLLTIILNFGIQ